MSDYIVQLKDDTGNKQYPVTLAQCIVDDDGTVIGEKLNMLETTITNLKTIDGQTLIGPGDITFKKINNQSILGEGQIDLSNLIADSAVIEYRPLLFEGDDDVPEGYDSCTAYNAETFSLFTEGKAIPVYMEVTPSSAWFYDNSNITLVYTIIVDVMKATIVVELSNNGLISTNSNDLFDSKFVDANSLIFYLDNTIGNTLNVDEAAVLSYISWCNIIHNVRNRADDPLNLPEPIAYVTASSDPTVSCIVNSTAVVGTGEGLIIEYDFRESRFRRTYTISGSDATYTEEEISLGGGAGEGAYIGPEQPDDNLPVNLWVDTSDDENATETISVVDHLTSTDSTAVLSANMGRELKTMIDNSIGDINTVLDNINGEIK